MKKNQRPVASCFVAMTIFSVLGSGPVGAAVLPVDPPGGSAPFHTIQAALDQAKAGDTVHVKPGVYQERVAFKNGGTPGAPVTLEGEPGAILDGSEKVALDWQPAPDIGPGVYRVALPFFPYTISVNGKLITTLDEKRADPSGKEPIHNGWKPLNWVEVFGGAGVGSSGWNGVVGLAMYRKKEQDLLIRFKDELDPRKMTITVGQRKPCIAISGQDRCVVRGMTLRYAAYGVMVENSLGTVIEKCTIGPVDYGVTLGTDSDRCTVRFNDISYDPYPDADFQRPGEWDAWQACKTGGFYDRWGIMISLTKGGHDIHDNDVHDEWDGIDATDMAYPPPHHGGTAETNAHIKIHHNHVHVIFDDAIETAGKLAGVEYYDNVFEHARCGFRIKGPVLGPIFSYHNFFLGNGEDYRNWGEVSFAVAFVPEQLKTEVWVYQNTSTSRAAVNMNYSLEPASAVSAVNYHYLNNLFWCRKWVQKKKEYPDPDWKGDDNVFVFASSPDSYPWDADAEKAKPSPEGLKRDWDDGIAYAKTCGIEAHSTWIADALPGFADVAKGDLSLTAASPARGKGADLNQVRTADGLPLPGISKSAQPDAGALQFGEAMPKVPRPSEEVGGPVAGSWP